MSQDSNAEQLESPEKEQKKLNILVVEDERGIRMMMGGFIETSTVPSQVGLIETAADGQEALEILKNNKGKFNVVITDGQMPKMGGLELAKKIKESGWDITVGLMSGDLGRLGLSNPETQASVMEDYGIAALLSKPFNLSQFGEFMQQIITVRAENSAASQSQTPQ
ncbi:MAG: response regulator [Candidatus Levybacteria bacterium]|nr:response regulator [Candidatus Levybacteria bacterium]